MKVLNRVFLIVFFGLFYSAINYFLKDFEMTVIIMSSTIIGTLCYNDIENNNDNI